MSKGIRFKRHYLALSVILLISFILNFYKLGQEGYGNLYYAAAVKSMLGNWHNFFFNSFDPKGFITIDKPPVGFWLQVLSASLFGFSGWSLFFPQALAGVLSTAMIYHLVARVFGKMAGLLSSLFLALTPIVVATDRTNEVDSVLMFVTLIAVWAISKTMEEERPFKWLLSAFFLIGVGFNIKMMEAFLVLPAFYLFYVLTPKLTWFQKTVHLVSATAILAVVSLSWSLIVDSIPADQRPYVGSTQNNSLLELAVGYNGINRLIGQQNGILKDLRLHQAQYANSQLNVNAVRSDGVSKVSSGNEQQKNPYTPWNEQNIPSAGGEKSGILRLFITPQLVGQVSWFLPWVLFSIISLLKGFRFQVLSDWKHRMVIFWIVWVLPMFIFFSHIAYMLNSYYLVMMAPGIAALSGIGFKEMWMQWHTRDNKGTWCLMLALVCSSLFEITVVWMYPEMRSTLSLSIVFLTLLALFCLLVIKISKAPGRRISIIAVSALILALVIAPAVWSISPIQYGGSASRPYAGPELKTQKVLKDRRFSPKLENYLKADYRQGTFLAATIDAVSAASLLLDTNLPVMAMGGYKGSDPALNVIKLQRMANEGQIRYFLLEENSSDYQQTAISDWIRKNCRIVPASKWQDMRSKISIRSGFGNSSFILYEYKKNIPG